MSKFFFYSKSKDSSPGKGTNECLEVKSTSQSFADLGEIKNWRKILSNFFVDPFRFEGKTYNTVEHAFQAQKIKSVDSKKWLRFTKESKDPIGLGDGLIARKNRKMVILTPKQLEKWGDVKHKVMFEVLKCRYLKSAFSVDVLIKTYPAELWHGTRFLKKHRVTSLEKARDILISKLKLATPKTVKPKST
jgi:predicted NAD-dependent protein-ADP-ribosyltransferase YbiA (DUF1768 family)